MASIVWLLGPVALPGARAYPAIPLAGVHSPLTASSRSRGFPVSPARPAIRARPAAAVRAARNISMSSYLR